MTLIKENIHNWEEITNSDNSPYRLSKWEDNVSLISFLLKHAKPGDWLDVGCGLGFFVECCDRYGITCYGVEGDASGVEIGKNRYPNLKIQTHNIINKLPFPDNSFSAIFCNQVIEHIPTENTEFVLSEIFRVLKEDGVAFINMPSIYNKEGRDEPSHINLMAPKKLIKYLKGVGFNYIKPTIYPRFIFGNNPFSKIISGLFFLAYPSDRLSSNCSAIAIKSNNLNPEIKGIRYFYFNKLLTW